MSTLISKLTFSWMSPVMKLGSERPLLITDLPDLPFPDQNSYTLPSLLSSYSTSLPRAILRTHWKHLLLSAFFKLFNDAAQFTGPLFLARIVQTVSDSSLSRTDRVYRGLFYAALIFVCQVAGALGEAQYFHTAMRVGVRIKSALIGMVFICSSQTAAPSGAPLVPVSGGPSLPRVSPSSQRVASGARVTSYEPLTTTQAGSASSSTARSGVTTTTLVPSGVTTTTVAPNGTTTSTTASNGAGGVSIVNLVSQDIESISSFTEYCHTLWSAPLRVSIALFFLYKQLGVVVLLGVGVILGMVVVQGVVVKRQMGLLREVQKQTDARVKMQSETLGGVKIVKCYTWEEAVLSKVREIRDNELKMYWRISVLRGINMFCVSAVPVVVAVVVFGMYMKVNKKVVSTEQAFVCLSLFGVLRFPLMMFPSIVNQLAGVRISLGRLEKFFASNGVSSDSPSHGITYGASQDGVWFKNASYMVSNGTGVTTTKATTTQATATHATTTQATATHATTTHATTTHATTTPAEAMTTPTSVSSGSGGLLHSITLTTQPGELLVITGPSGSGKSLLLSAILGQLQLTSGEAQDAAQFPVSYVPQTPWIFSGTVRENVLLGAVRVDEAAYKAALEASCLGPDLASLANGDLTEIGERGVTLSGGQKARVSLARAFYFSSRREVTAEVTLGAYEPNSPSQTTEAGTAMLILDDPLSALDVVVANRVFQQGVQHLCKSMTRVLVTNRLEFAAFADRVVVMEEGRIKAIGSFDDVKHILPVTAAAVGESVDVVESPKAVAEAVAQPEAAKEQVALVKKEESQTGSINIIVIKSYINAMNKVLFYLILSGYILSETGKTLSYFFLQSEYAMELDVGMFIWIYAGLSLVQLIGILYGQILIAWTSKNASKTLHEQMWKSLLYGSMSFFYSTPIGRIQNRLSKDIYEIDRNVGSSLIFCISGFLGLLSTLVTLGIAEYKALLCFLPVLVFFYKIQSYYRASSREIKRIEAVTRSPILNLLQQTIDGVNTLVAYKQQDAMVRGPAGRLVDIHLRAYYAQFSCNRWLGVRLEFFGGILVLFVAVAVVLSDRGNTAGIAIFAALQVTGALNMLVRVLAMTENSFNSVERVIEYCKIDTEKNPDLPTSANTNQLKDDSVQGSLEFKEVVMRYGMHLAPALAGVSFKLLPGEKVGVIGRTGAGKSSLLAALFNLHSIESGDILIDGASIESMSLKTLRSQLSIIPQDPVVFGGSVRYNVDPFDRFSELQVQQALEKAHLPVSLTSDAASLSAGQRQLLCLARVLLQQPKILVLDEATSSLDPVTDSLVQKTLETNFRSTTVLTIAHRLQTVLGADKILVMADGSVAEFGPVQELKAKQGGLFRAFLQEARLLD